MILPNLREIEKRRRKLGLTQARLANMADISRSSLAKIEEAYRIRGPMERPRYVPNYEDAKRIMESLEREESSRLGGIFSKKVSSVAQSPVRYVRPDDTVGTAKTIMKQYDFSQLPVLKRGLCVGRINESTILEAINAEGNLEATYAKKVKDIMGEAFPSVNQSTNVQSIIALIKEQKAVLVLGRSGEVSGIVTAFDVMV